MIANDKTIHLKTSMYFALKDFCESYTQYTFKVFHKNVMSFM